MPLASALSDGDVVEVLTTASGDTGRSRDWLEFVKTPQAQLKVRQWFADQRRRLAIDAGRRAVGETLASPAWIVQQLLSQPQPD